MWGTPLFALRIDNPEIRIVLSPGESYAGTITIDNPSPEEAGVRVYLEDFIYIPPFDGSKEFYSAGTTRYSLSRWITFSPHEFTLAPYSRQTVNFTLKPDEKFSSLHCGVLFFETIIGSTYDEKGRAINVLGRLGSLIFVEPQEAQKRAEFKDLETSLNKLKGKFKNRGNTFLHVQGTFYIMNEEGMVKDRGSLRELYLLPEDVAVLDIDLSKSLSPGKYTAVFTFDMEEGDVLVKEVDFSVSSPGELKILEIRD